MQFGFLSTLDNPLLPRFINESITAGVNNIHIIIDSKSLSKKDREIFKQRTNDIFGSYGEVNKLLFGLEKISIPFYFVNNHNSINAIDLYKILKINCILNAGTPRKLSQNILNMIPNGIVNVHPGILPHYRGCSCVEWAILNDDQIGNTAHFMDCDYDTGPIIYKETYRFDSKSNYFDIRNKIYLEGIKMAARVIKGIQDENIKIENSIKQEKNIGKFWEPIPSNLEKKAIIKANEHKYKFQNL